MIRKAKRKLENNRYTRWREIFDDIPAWLMVRRQTDPTPETERRMDGTQDDYLVVYPRSNGDVIIETLSEGESVAYELAMTAGDRMRGEGYTVDAPEQIQASPAASPDFYGYIVNCKMENSE